MSPETNNPTKNSPPGRLARIFATLDPRQKADKGHLPEFLALIGFLTLVIGIAVEFSPAAAAITAGGLLLGAGILGGIR